MVTDPDTESQRRPLDRRQFLSGSWDARRDIVESQPVDRRESATILVQARPERLADIECKLQSLGGLTISRCEAAGKLQITTVLTESRGLLDALESITALPGILAATLTGAKFSEDIA